MKNVCETCNGEEIYVAGKIGGAIIHKRCWCIRKKWHNIYLEQVKKRLDGLKEGDFVAFFWNNGQERELIVDSITKVSDSKVLVHFMKGFRSEAEWVRKEDIVAVGDPEATDKIEGWGGTYYLLRPELLN